MISGDPEEDVTVLEEVCKIGQLQVGAPSEVKTQLQIRRLLDMSSAILPHNADPADSAFDSNEARCGRGAVYVDSESEPASASDGQEMG